ncbi:MAG: biotin transporter BioY [Chloroflexi bacterium]|nr:biotin transporter BioY [Chloroflexota bacterium]
MLRTFPQTRTHTLSTRLLAIAAFTLLTMVSARVTLEIGPVPFTLQVLVVLLAGLVLGARDGALSQIAYLALIAANLPVDARMIGAAAFAGPTAGYLIGFVPAAYAAGWLAERGGSVLWWRWLAGVAGIAVIYVCGALLLKISTGIEWHAVWATGVAPFIAADLLKALIAAGLAEGGRALLLRHWA